MDEYNNAEICDRNNNDKKKALWEWVVTEGGGFIFSSNCRLVKLRAAYQVLQNHKFTSPSSGRSCNLTRVKLSGDIFPFLD